MKTRWRLESVSVEGRLEDVSLHVKGVMGVLGPNGSGKTTLLMVASGALRPSKGYVERPSRIGAAWQNPYMSFHRPKVVEEVAEVAGGRSEALRLLRESGLEHTAERSPFTLSLGEARRLSIILAVAWEPDAIVLDEPTAGLDVYWKRWLIKLIESLGRPVLMATHDPLFTLAVTESVVSLRRGRVVYNGAPERAPEVKGLSNMGVGRCEARCLYGL